MDNTTLTAVLGLLIALSAASERVVEIVKGLSTWLDEKKATENEERKRRLALHVLATAAGIGVTLMAAPAIPSDLLPDNGRILGLVALGLLASGGSGLWNSVLTYLLQLKDIKEGIAKELEALHGARQSGATSTQPMAPIVETALRGIVAREL